jgi:hypothetical protein
MPIRMAEPPRAAGGCSPLPAIGRACHTARRPPSTGRTVPWIMLASFEARNTTALAISSGVAISPRRTRSLTGCPGTFAPRSSEASPDRAGQRRAGLPTPVPSRSSCSSGPASANPFQFSRTDHPDSIRSPSCHHLRDGRRPLDSRRPKTLPPCLRERPPVPPGKRRTAPPALESEAAFSRIAGRHTECSPRLASANAFVDPNLSCRMYRWLNV